VVDGGEPGVGSRDEGKHTGRNDLLFVEKMMWIVDGRASSEFDDTMLYQIVSYRQTQLRMARTMVFVLAILKCNFIFTWKVYRDRFVAK